MNTYCSMMLMASLSAGCTPTGVSDAMGPRDERAAPLLGAPETDPQATEVVAFWREAGPSRWFAKDPAFDARFRERFLALHERVVRGELADWVRTPEGLFALIILVDQFPRNAFRGTPRMYQTDQLARIYASRAVAVGFDRQIEEPLRVFVYLPFGHSESLADQERSVSLARMLGQPHLAHAEGHRDIVKRFGRFPHRNAILGRPTTAEEQKFLDEGGFAG